MVLLLLCCQAHAHFVFHVCMRRFQESHKAVRNFHGTENAITACLQRIADGEGVDGACVCVCVCVWGEGGCSREMTFHRDGKRE